MASVAEPLTLQQGKFPPFGPSLVREADSFLTHGSIYGVPESAYKEEGRSARHFGTPVTCDLGRRRYLFRLVFVFVSFIRRRYSVDFIYLIVLFLDMETVGIKCRNRVLIRIMLGKMSLLIDY